MKVEREVDIAASAQDIYDVVMDPDRLKDWVSIHQSLEDAPKGGMRKGSTLTQYLKLAGRSFKVEWTVTENEKAKRVTWDGKGPLRSKAKVVYDMSDSSGDSTHFVYMNEYQLPGGTLGKMAGPAVRKVTGKELDASLQNLRKIVE
jgi:uncharacterized membrane protein